MKRMARRLIEKRLQHNMTQEQVAGAVDPPVRRVTVSNWERSKKIPSVRRLRQLAELFNTSMDYLAGLSPDDPQNERETL